MAFKSAVNTTVIPGLTRNLFFAIAVALLAACSSDDSSNPVNTGNSPAVTLPADLNGQWKVLDYAGWSDATISIQGDSLHYRAIDSVWSMDVHLSYRVESNGLSFNCSYREGKYLRYMRGTFIDKNNWVGEAASGEVGYGIYPGWISATRK